jgi:tellurite resistance protein TerC
LEVPWFVYAIFIGFVISMLLVDLKVFHSDPEEEPSVKQSAVWVVVWIGLGVAFGIGILVLNGSKVGAEYFAGYIIEKALSVDNMFVFVVIFGYFGIPLAYQHQVLFYGILGALIFRGLFIALGVTLINAFEWIIYVFGAFLLYTAFRVARGATENIHPEDNPVLKFAQRRFSSTTRFDGHNLFTIEDGRRVATPLFITLLFVETTDIVFAVDSIPAIFGITQDAFIVLTSNVFAVLGLRALYFLLAGALKRLHLLNYGLAIVLGFVGVKMLLEAVPCSGEWLLCGEHHIEIPIWLSLSFIVTVLSLTTLLSLTIPPPKEEPGEELERPALAGAEKETGESSEERSREADSAKRKRSASPLRSER